MSDAQRTWIIREIESNPDPEGEAQVRWFANELVKRLQLDEHIRQEGRQEGKEEGRQEREGAGQLAAMQAMFRVRLGRSRQGEEQRTLAQRLAQLGQEHLAQLLFEKTPHDLAA